MDLPLLKKRLHRSFLALIFMGAAVKDSVVLITNLNLKFFGLQIFNCEGSHNFLKRNLELAHTQYIGLYDHNSISVKNGIFLR